MNRPQVIALVLITMISATQSGCMKTRSQIKNSDSQDQSEGGASNEEKAATNQRVSRNEIEEIKNELTRISGKVEELDHTQQTNKPQELKEYMTKLDERIADLEKNQLLVMNELKAIKDKETAAAKEAATPVSELFKSANFLLREKKYEEAAEKFRSILNKNVKGKEAAEAHFGLGESEYGLKNYKKAIVQYSKVQEVLPKSTHAPTCLYKIGLAFSRLNMNKEAKGFFNELLERYPKSVEAKKIRARSKKE